MSDWKFGKREAKAHRKLIDAAHEKGFNCDGLQDSFTADILPSQAVVDQICSPCPVWAECHNYKVVAKPPHGVYANERIQDANS